MPRASTNSAEDIRIGELEKQTALLKESVQKTTDDLHKAETLVKFFERQVVLLQESVQRQTDDLQKVDVRVCRCSRPLTHSPNQSVSLSHTQGNKHCVTGEYKHDAAWPRLCLR